MWGSVIRMVMAAGLSAALGLTTPGAATAAPSVANGVTEPTGWHHPATLVARTTGLLMSRFNDKPAELHMCTASVVDTTKGGRRGNRSTVVTAAHCVYNLKAQKAYDQVVFLPSYGQGGAGDKPHESWMVRPGRTYFPEQFKSANLLNPHRYDYAFLVLGPRPGSSIDNLQELVQGAQPFRPLGRSAKDEQVWLFGYRPADPPNPTDKELAYCNGEAKWYFSEVDDLACNGVGGMSGGPVFHDFDPQTGRGNIISVVSGLGDRKYPSLQFAELGADAQALFERARKRN